MKIYLINLLRLFIRLKICYIIREIIIQNYSFVQRYTFSQAQNEKPKIYPAKAFICDNITYDSKFKMNLSRKKEFGTEKLLWAYFKSPLFANNSFFSKFSHSPCYFQVASEDSIENGLKIYWRLFENLRKTHTHRQKDWLLYNIIVY